MTDRQRIAQRDRDVKRLEDACVWLAARACEDSHGRVWWPQWGPIARLMARSRTRKKKAAA